MSQEPRQPLVDKSNLTIEGIRQQIPPHYFKQNTIKSFAHLAFDLVQTALWAYLFYAVVFPFTNQYHWAVSFVAWNVYWFIQGLNFGALWVLAHECGHGGFSSINTVNTVVGWTLHSALLVPYQSWKFTHATHHRFCNNIEKDTVFLPDTKKTPLREAVEESPIVSLIMVIVMFTLGWPFHLAFNMAGQTRFPGNKSRINHYEPSSPLFKPHQRLDVVFADIGVVIALACIAYASSIYGFANVVCWYGIPYLYTNSWLVGVTFLQHTDLSVPHYSEEKFSFLKGALATVDRDFGWFINWKLHHIQDSHVVHHLFSSMPFYNAIEVTEKHIKPILGDYYMRDNSGRSYLGMIWHSWRNCHYCVPSEGITYFRK